MAPIKQILFNEINDIFKEKQTFYFVLTNNQFIQFNKSVIVLLSKTDIRLLSAEPFNLPQNVLSNVKLWRVDIKGLEQLVKLYKQYNLKDILILNVGIITQNNLKMAIQVSFIAKQMSHKLDNENLAWVGFSDGSQYKENNSLRVYFNENEAQADADKLGAFLAKYSIVSPLFENIFKTNEQYCINGQVVPGSVLMAGIKKRFKDTMLNFEDTKRYVDLGLSVYAGKTEDEFKIFQHYKMATFFTPSAETTLINPLILNKMPSNSIYYPVRNRESLYTFSNSKYVFFDCIYHTDISTFENAIDGKEYTTIWNQNQKKEKTQQLFQQQFLYIILSDLNYKASNKSSWPNIVNAYHRKVWIFEDYGKALMFCQQKHLFTEDGFPLIGLLSPHVQGLDLHSTLSLLLYQNVDDVELNPMEDDRMLLSIKDMLNWQNLSVIAKEKIHRTGKKDVYTTYESEQEEFIFNDIMLT